MSAISEIYNRTHNILEITDKNGKSKLTDKNLIRISKLHQIIV